MTYRLALSADAHARHSLSVLNQLYVMMFCKI